jgi:hypothetical protein
VEPLKHSLGEEAFEACLGGQPCSTSWPSELDDRLEDSVARDETKGLPALDSVDREIRTIRRKHGSAIELFGSRDERASDRSR